MSNLQVIIYLNHDAFNAGKKAFERMVSYSEAVHVDFVGIANTLRFLFGSQSIVSFNIF